MVNPIERDYKKRFSVKVGQHLKLINIEDIDFVIKKLEFDENDLDFEPDYYLCLAWNFKDFFLKKYATYLDAGGQMVFPHPQLEIVGRSKNTTRK